MRPKAMRPEAIGVFLKLVGMYMSETYDYKILSMTGICDEKADHAMLIRLAEYAPSGSPDEYNLIFKVYFDEKHRDASFAVFNDNNDNCLEIKYDANSYTQEMIQAENKLYKDFLLKSFSNFF